MNIHTRNTKTRYRHQPVCVAVLLGFEIGYIQDKAIRRLYNNHYYYYYYLLTFLTAFTTTSTI